MMKDCIEAPQRCSRRHHYNLTMLLLLLLHYVVADSSQMKSSMIQSENNLWCQGSESDYEHEQCQPRFGSREVTPSTLHPLPKQCLGPRD